MNKEEERKKNARHSKLYTSICRLDLQLESWCTIRSIGIYMSKGLCVQVRDLDVSQSEKLICDSLEYATGEDCLPLSRPCNNRLLDLGEFRCKLRAILRSYGIRGYEAARWHHLSRTRMQLFRLGLTPERRKGRCALEEAPSSFCNRASSVKDGRRWYGNAE